MLQIYLHGDTESGFLDLVPGATLDFEGLTNLFDEELDSGEFSLPIDIPWTENNRRLWRFAERIENADNRKNFRECTVYDEGFPELVRVKITIVGKEGKFSYDSGVFKASISGVKGLFGSRIRKRKLTDLKLDGPIEWADDESRIFATKCMKGLYPQYPYLAFAPVAIENYFDESNSYHGEFLAKDTVNNIVSTGGGLNDWVFGRPRSTDPFAVTDPGDEEHIDHRTIPFFQFTYILRKVFEEAGYEVVGDITQSDAFSKLYLFNNASLEFYSTVVYRDYNRKIYPKDHLPEMGQDEFLRAVCKFFGMFPDFVAHDKVQLKFRHPVLKEKEFLDITDRCNPRFSQDYVEQGENDGYSIEYEWDSNDDYLTDRVKDISTKTLVATVSTFPELALIDIGRTLTTDDMAFVVSENMYYIVADGTSIPVKWDAWSENLDKFTKGRGDRSVTLPVSTLCTYVEFDEPNALYLRRNKVGCRQPGTYWNNKLSRVKNPFGLRLFYISKQNVIGNEIPVSHNHHLNSSGVQVASFSLSLNGENGMAKNYHELWQDAIQRNQTVKVTVRADKRFIQELSRVNIVRIQNVFYLYKVNRKSIPLRKNIELEIVPL